MPRFFSTFLLWAALLLTAAVEAQSFPPNLVFNPSFEEHECPTNQSQIDFALGWKTVTATPDLYAVCSTYPTVRLPTSQTFFYHMPATGEAMAFVLTGLEVSDESFGSSLLDTLHTGRAYYAEFMYHMTNPKPEDISFRSYCYNNNINLCFSDSLALSRCNNLLFQESTIVPFFDTTQWIKRSGIVYGNGENHIIVGTFFGHSADQVTCLHEERYLLGSGGFIDDIVVRAIGFDADTLLLCAGERYPINLYLPEADVYAWSTGSSHYEENIEEAGNYYVSITLGDVIFRDTLVVLDAYQIAQQYFKDTTLCEGSTHHLQLDFLEKPSTHFRWEDGSQEANRTFSQPGRYTLRADFGCGPQDFSFELTVLDCDCQLYIPNAFSPNYDGINDVFEAAYYCEGEVSLRLDMDIFDRWGGWVYSCKGCSIAAWDGTRNGQRLPAGIYVYRILAVVEQRGGSRRSKAYQGELHLLP